MQIDLSVKNVIKQFGSFTAVNSVSFDIEKGKFFSILGPSGCGKTTLLRMIAGFSDPTSGSLEIRGKDVIGVAPNKRPVNMVFQHLALFPMMNVAENIAFGLKRRREKKDVINQKVTDILARVGLEGYGDKQVTQLSGGQKQRVAIARSLILDPTVLLLDEPLGALDLKLREHMKVELKSLQHQIGTTFMYITHDQSEALVMSDYVAVMNKGAFEQVDTPQNLYNNPKTPFVAMFVGDNNSWSGSVKSIEGDIATIITEEGNQFQTKIKQSVKVGNSADLYLRPEAMLIQPDPSLKDINRFNVKVKAILFDGARSRLQVFPENSTKEILVALPQNRQFDNVKPGDQLEIGWDRQSGICFPK